MKKRIPRSRSCYGAAIAGVASGDGSGVCASAILHENSNPSIKAQRICPAALPRLRLKPKTRKNYLLPERCSDWMISPPNSLNQIAERRAAYRRWRMSRQPGRRSWFFSG